MYNSIRSGNILLWCDACTPTPESKKQLEKETRKCKHSLSNPPTSKRQQAKEDIDDLVMVLKGKCGTKYAIRLAWFL